VTIDSVDKLRFAVLEQLDDGYINPDRCGNFGWQPLIECYISCWTAECRLVSKVSINLLIMSYGNVGSKLCTSLASCVSLTSCVTGLIIVILVYYFCTRAISPL
jgi:hypothetical protein